jgi:S-DNA-T family DNA segregation ATPase FtsK/SpoIIIE
VALKPAKEPKRERGKKATEAVPPPIFLGVDVSAAPTEVFGEGPAAGDGGSVWTLPRVVDVLESGTDVDVNSASIRERVEVIEHTLDSFGAPATVVEINQGPTITQFGVEPNYVVLRGGKRTKVKVGKIAGLADDLALALAARSIRIQAPVPGKGYVGIEVPNSAKALVSLRDVMESDEYGKMKSPLKIGLGQNVAGQPIVADLAAMPHMLIAGTTGSGKSVCVNGLIACLLVQNTPDDLRLVMIDPKRVELTGYNGVPHLAAPVVVDMDRVIGTLQWALREMDNRYKLFAGVGARNINEYNKKTRRDANPNKLPYIVIIIDELADLMMLAPEDTERSITRLAQMARATGIHMVIATQRPSVDVVTGLIKANFPARIAFAVASSTDSRVILDTTGAERLLGQGDMLFQSPDAAAPVRLQGCFVSDGELQKLISYWQTARRTQFIGAPGSGVAGGEGRVASGAGPVILPSPNLESAPTTVSPTSRTRPGRAADVPPPVVHLNPPEPTGGPPPPQRRAPQIPTAPAGDTKYEIRNTSSETAANARPMSNDYHPTAHPADGITQQPLWEALQAMDDEAGNGNGEDDDLLPEAIAMVRSLNKASTSLLQRRFRIGYTRAARLMDALEDAGIIGPPTGTSKAREVFGAAAQKDESEELPQEEPDSSDPADDKPL